MKHKKRKKHHIGWINDDALVYCSVKDENYVVKDHFKQPKEEWNSVRCPGCSVYIVMKSNESQ